MARIKIKCEKKTYKDRKTAWESALGYFKNLGTYSTPYKCRLCKKFHLTSKWADLIPSPEFKKGFNKWFGKEIL